MKRTYIQCHMTMSLDGKVTGDFLASDAGAAAGEVYYELHRRYRAAGYAGFICGRVTMEGSFTQGWYPDLTGFAAVDDGADWFPEGMDPATTFFAVAFDSRGRLGWRSAKIADPDPGYDGANVLEVLSHAADPRYIGYLRAAGIPYIYAGACGIDVQLALEKLHRLGIGKLLLEGGSILNEAFLAAGCVDALSLVVAPQVAGPDSRPLFGSGTQTSFTLETMRRGADDTLILTCLRKNS